MFSSHQSLGVEKGGKTPEKSTPKKSENKLRFVVYIMMINEVVGCEKIILKWYRNTVFYLLF